MQKLTKNIADIDHKAEREKQEGMMSEWKKAGSAGAQAHYGKIALVVYPTTLPAGDRWYCTTLPFVKYLESKTLSDAKVEAKTWLCGILEEAVEAIRKEG